MKDVEQKSASQDGMSPSEDGAYGRETGVLNFDCHACGSSNSVVLVPAFSQRRRVTSDCKTWDAGGRIGSCHVCGLIQKPTDQAWQRESAQIYESYSIYHQGGGQEPTIYVGGFEQLVVRSVQLFRSALAELNLKGRGRLLDFGCGNGAALRAIGPMLPDWTLEGIEIDDKYLHEVEAIPGVVKCHVGQLSEYLGPYDLVTLVHVLEHIADPLEMLARIRKILKPDGAMLVVLPAVESNPFDLAVADHCSHFDKASLQNILERADFEDVYVNDQWMSRQLTAIARIKGSRRKRAASLKSRDLENIVEWLGKVSADAAQHAASGSFGIFGSSNNAVWLAGELDKKLDFFVDEDTSRIGHTLLGKPIIAPGAVPAGSSVYVAMPFPWCEAIAKRLSRVEVKYLIPPSMTAI